MVKGYHSRVTCYLIRRLLQVRPLPWFRIDPVLCLQGLIWFTAGARGQWGSGATIPAAVEVKKTGAVFTAPDYDQVAELVDARQRPLAKVNELSALQQKRSRGELQVRVLPWSLHRNDGSNTSHKVRGYLSRLAAF